MIDKDTMWAFGDRDRGPTVILTPMDNLPFPWGAETAEFNVDPIHKDCWWELLSAEFASNPKMRMHDHHIYRWHTEWGDAWMTGNSWPSHHFIFIANDEHMVEFWKIYRPTDPVPSDRMALYHDEWDSGGIVPHSPLDTSKWHGRSK